jgi:hypothetical protein
LINARLIVGDEQHLLVALKEGITEGPLVLVVERAVAGDDERA